MATAENGGDAALVPSQALPQQTGGNNTRNSNRPRRQRRRGKKKAEASENKSGDSSKPKRRNNNRRRRGKAKYPWRRYIPPGTVDPITLDPLVSLNYPPFALVATEPYVPVVEWPVVEEKTTEKKEPDEKMTAEERQRRIMQEQWGQTAAAVSAAEEGEKDETKQPITADRPMNLFDGHALAIYLVSQLQFIDPFNRRDLTRDELLNLDAYLVRHGFTDVRVVEAYDAKGVTLSTAGALGNTAEGRAEILQQEAQVLLNALFTSQNRLEQQYAASQQQQANRSRRQEVQTEDTGIYETEGMVIIDDDANPGLRGREIQNEEAEEGVPTEAAAAGSLWSASHITSNYSHSARAAAHNFPALPTPSAPSAATTKSKAEKGPSKSLQRISKVVAPTDPAAVQRQKEAREEAQRRAALAHLSYIPPGASLPASSMTASGQAGIQQSETSAPSEGQIKRNQALASALGVAPATVRHQLNAGWARPTDGLDEFGNELNAALYPDSLIMVARERMEQLLKLERRWKTFLADDSSASLPLRPMDRELRTFVHEYSDYWKLHTESFDPEPKRYIHCVKLRDTSAPVPLLSEAARNWRGPTTAAAALEPLPPGPREAAAVGSDHTLKQTAGQATLSRDFPPAPQREPLKLKPRSVPPREEEEEEAVDARASEKDDTGQLSTRFDSLFSGRERPKLELAPRTVPLELPQYQPSKVYNVAEERERQKAAMEEKTRKEREKAQRKAAILASAFASSDEEESLASAGGSSDWEESDEQYSGSDDEEEVC